MREITAKIIGINNNSFLLPFIPLILWPIGLLITWSLGIFVPYFVGPSNLWSLDPSSWCHKPNISLLLCLLCNGWVAEANFCVQLSPTIWKMIWSVEDSVWTSGSNSTTIFGILVLSFDFRIVWISSMHINNPISPNPASCVVQVSQAAPV